MINLTLFTAKWCAPCKAFAPKLQAMCDQLGITLTTQDIEQGDVPPEVRSVPTVMAVLPDMGGYATFFTGTDLAPIRATLKEYGV